jgi:uncharacterized SAM-binding protein YcdF (DUF218 family)
MNTRPQVWGQLLVNTLWARNMSTTGFTGDASAVVFFLKKLASFLFLPLPFCLGLAVAGLVLMWFTRRQRAGRIATTAGVALLTLLGFRGVSNLFITPLENDFRPLMVAGAPGNVLDARAQEARWIVVLGGGHTWSRQLPPNSELNVTTLARIVEAVRLKRLVPRAKLILSGGFGGSVTHAEILASTAVALGVPREELVLETRTFDTADEARFISPIVGQDPFILVSSASHLPRAVALFRKQGRSPIPSPADFTNVPGMSLEGFFPTSSSIGKLERASHEYVGWIWSKLRGQL